MGTAEAEEVAQLAPQGIEEARAEVVVGCVGC